MSRTDDELRAATAVQDAQQATLDRSEHEARQRVGGVNAGYDEVMAAHWAKVDEAVASGSPPPDPPVKPDLSAEDAAGVRRQALRERLRVERQEALAQALPDITSAAMADLASLREDGRPKVEAVLALWAEVRRVQGIVTLAREADDMHGQKLRLAARTRDPVTLDELIAFVNGDDDLLALVEPPAREGLVQLVGMGNDERPKPGGATRWDGIGTPPSWPRVDRGGDRGRGVQI